ncbi:DUF2884 domain-containing protein [Photorhabdus akhurstii]|uniref:DUF2884 domain-containing protein n=1 Tax=Photorhabdus akhurstii TaxID=171438 RepID=UPI000D4B89FB|nr:DUF2884 domain-containing protein [Photorhabdus akhurstii]MBS9430503.1 DUF2884 family protein [Photorhabdus akhurstii]PQQ40976.1 hypothetical protein C6H65_12015 [Photorhabdus luminescens]
MLRKIITVASLLFVAQAQAGYECQVNPQNDIIITSQSVQVVGASGNLQISPDGSVIRDGKNLSLNTEQRQKAQRYQQALRQDLPWIKQETGKHLITARKSLDKVVVDTIGKDSNVRNRLSELESGLNQQINRIIETRADGMAFHHQAIKQVEKDSRSLIEQSLGGVLQDSINEIGNKQFSLNGDNNQALQSLLGSLGGLQNNLKAEWRVQEEDFQRFGKEVCGKVSGLEQQRIELLNSIK